MARRSVETEAMLELADELTRFQESAKGSDQPDIGEENINSSEMRPRLDASRSARQDFVSRHGIDGIRGLRTG
jgi:hypothetical protein